MKQEDTEEYKLGFEVGGAGGSKEYTEKFGPIVGGSLGWSNFIWGQAAKGRIEHDIKFKEYKLDEFNSKLKTLCDEYDVSISFGCGCCGGGAQCKDLEFSITQ